MVPLSYDAEERKKVHCLSYMLIPPFQKSALPRAWALPARLIHGIAEQGHRFGYSHFEFHTGIIAGRI